MRIEWSTYDSVMRILLTEHTGCKRRMETLHSMKTNFWCKSLTADLLRSIRVSRRIHGVLLFIPLLVALGLMLLKLRDYFTRLWNTPF